MKLTRLQVANGIYDKLRLAIVAGGYFPDILAFTDPDDPAGFQAAKDAIIAGGKELIEVHNLGNWRDRQQMNPNDIFIDSQGNDPSVTGTRAQSEYAVNQGDPERFDKVKSTDALYDISFQIRFFAESMEYSGIIEQFLVDTFGITEWVMAKDDSFVDLDNFPLHRVGSFDTSGEKFIEAGFSYSAIGINLAGSKSKGEVHRFEEFTFEQKLSEIDPEDGLPDTSITVDFTQ